MLYRSGYDEFKPQISRSTKLKVHSLKHYPPHRVSSSLGSFTSGQNGSAWIKYFKVGECKANNHHQLARHPRSNRIRALPRCDMGTSGVPQWSTKCSSKAPDAKSLSNIWVWVNTLPHLRKFRVEHVTFKVYHILVSKPVRFRLLPDFIDRLALSFGKWFHAKTPSSNS